MHSMSLNKFFDFMQVLNSIRTYSMKNGYFPKYISFSTIYVQWEQKLNHINYSKQKINMSNFVKTTKHAMNMYAKFEYFTFYVFL
jgi:hypothetical protein